MFRSYKYGCCEDLRLIAQIGPIFTGSRIVKETIKDQFLNCGRPMGGIYGCIPFLRKRNNKRV